MVINLTDSRTIAEGNAGDQIKTTGPTHVENVITVSNCGYFDFEKAHPRPPRSVVGSFKTHFE